MTDVLVETKKVVTPAMGADRKLGRLNRHRRTVYTLFLIPSLIMVIALIAYPVVTAFINSMESGNTFNEATTHFVGFDNYAKFFADPAAFQIIVNSFIRAFGGVVPSYILGLVAALALNRVVRGRGVVQVLVLLPFVISGAVSIATWKLVFDPLTGIMPALGLGGVDLFTNTTWVWPTLLFMNAWGSFQFYSIIFLATLQRIPPELHEAAQVDGAGGFQRFRAVTMPALAGVSAAVCALHFLGSFQEFNLVYIATGGGPLNATQTMATYSYMVGFGGSYDLGYASAITYISAAMMALTLGIAVLIYLVIVRSRARLHVAKMRRWLAMAAAYTPSRTPSRRRSRSGARAPRWVRPVGRWIGVLVLILFSSFPVIFLLSRSFDAQAPEGGGIRLFPAQFTFQHWIDAFSSSALFVGTSSSPPLIQNLLNSVIVLVCVTAIALVVSLFGGYGLARVGARRGGVAAAVLLATQLIPSIILVFPIYIMAANFKLLNQAGLIIAVSIMFVPMATLFFQAYFRDIGPELEEAAAIDGAGPVRTFLSVIVPQARSAIGAMVAFMLISAWNEYMFALTLIIDANQQTFPPALANFTASYQFQSEAGPGGQAVYLLIPIILSAILLSFTLKSFTNAVAGGGTKG